MEPIPTSVIEVVSIKSLLAKHVFNSKREPIVILIDTHNIKPTPKTIITGRD